MATSNIATVVGTDGVVPIYDPSGNWKMWALSEVYTGATGTSKYVPKIKDYVIDPDTFTTYVVKALDPVTLIPTLKQIRPSGMSYTLDETDVLFGVGPGTQADTYRVYLDTGVTPHVMSVDTRLRVAGTMTSYVKIFRGPDIAETGEVISKVYDTLGNFVSENVPLELAAIDTHNNYSIKIVPPCNCMTNMADGEIVTAVFYSDNGFVVSKRQLLVENTRFTRSLSASKKYVSGISLESAFLSASQDSTLLYPLNIPLNALNLTGVVNYSDGSKLKLPVDGTKFKMFGLDQYVSSIIGQRMDLALVYTLSQDETAYGATGVGNKYVTEPYYLQTVNPNNSYSVKLFGFPYWNNNNGYLMRWFLLNLDRNVWFEVPSSALKWSSTTGSYDPKGYGYLQRKTVSVNLRDLSGAFKPFVHVQTLDIVLNGPPATGQDPWSVLLEAGTSQNAYGVGVFAKLSNSVSVDISCELTDQEAWLDRVYRNISPLLIPNTEVTPLTPTHFVVTYQTKSVEFPLSDWDKALNLGTTLSNYETLTVRFIKRTGSTDMQLGVSAIMIRP